MKPKVLISVIVLLLCIAATVGLRIAMDRADTAYDEVKVTVVSSETKQKRVLWKRMTVYEVIVRYEGEKYELKNAHDTYSYQPGRQMTVFLSGGELFANVQGVRTSTPVAKVYFAFLFASFGMVFVTITMAGQARRSA